MKICDMHAHSGYSYDVPKNDFIKIARLAAEAKENGVDVLALTDHYDLDLIQSGKVTFDTASHKAEMLEAKKTFCQGNTVGAELLYGIELGQLTQYPDEGRKLISECGFDFVIGSLHNVRNKDDYWMWEYEHFSDKELIAAYNEYLDELCELVTGVGDGGIYDFDTLAHITYPLRYFKRANRNTPADIDLYTEHIRVLFGIMIAKGVPLEINTSGLRQGMGDCLPPLSLAKVYYSMGGRMLTIGSDAHRGCDIGADIKEVCYGLLNIGFPGVLIFRNRKSELIPFE